ncbi:hypothetical protein [Kitasatospora sp. NPDC008115]|uniref:hypothetical protein n=1 Tax=Kitasatospora sp. NPDC008115 TaxID=3364022 RepID=UPI0036EB37B5
MATPPFTNTGENGTALFTAWRPSLRGGDYTITATHTVTRTGDSAPTWTFSPPTQRLTAGGPRFTLTGAELTACFPPPSASGAFGHLLPFVAIADPYLPWERELEDPDGKDKELWEAAPWMALLVLSEADLKTAPVLTGQARALLDAKSVPASTTVPILQLPEQAPCTVLDLPAGLYRALMPEIGELALWAHVREQRTSDASAGKAGARRATATVIGARLPRAPGRYSAHLVSLDGHDKTLATPPADGRVRLVSLHSWTFTTADSSADDPGIDLDAFEALKKDVGLGHGSHGRLRVPGAAAGTGAAARLYAGYLPVPLRLVTGEQTWAWYRGPFIPGPEQDAPAHAPLSCADAALAYVKGEGVFDITAAAAFSLGAQLVLSRNDLCDTMLTWHRDAAALARATALATHPHNAARPLNPLGGTGPLDPNGVLGLTDRARLRDGFDQAMRNGLGERLTAALHTPPSLTPPAAEAPAPRASVPGRLGALLADPQQTQSLTEALAVRLAPSPATRAGDGDNGAQEWLWDPLAMLMLVPTWYLLPLPDAVLPHDSARFFHLDGTWLNAFADGMLSIGTHTETDQQLNPLIKEIVFKPRSPGTAPGCGLLLRSPIVRHWPPLHTPGSGGSSTEPAHGEQLSVTVTGASVVSARRLSAEVLLLLFDTTPEAIELRQPAHVLEYGLDGPQGKLALRGSDGSVLQQDPLDVLGGTTLLREPVSSGHDREVLRAGALLDAVLAHLPQKPARDSEALAFQLLQPPAELTITPPPAT